MFWMSTENARHEFAKQGIKNRPVLDRAIHVSSDISSRLYLLFAVLSKEKQDAKQEDRQNQDQVQGKRCIELIEKMLIHRDVVEILERTKRDPINGGSHITTDAVARDTEGSQQKNDHRINADNNLCRKPAGIGKPFHHGDTPLSPVNRHFNSNRFPSFTFSYVIIIPNIIFPKIIGMLQITRVNFNICGIAIWIRPCFGKRPRFCIGKTSLHAYNFITHSARSLHGIRNLFGYCVFNRTSRPVVT